MTMTMHLGSYEFEWFPDRWTIPRPVKYTARVKTYSSAAFISFGASIVGQEIMIEWDWMPEDMFAAIDSIVQDDEQEIWIPGNGDAYNVEIVSFDGEYFETTAYEFPYRRNCKLLLMIMSVNNAYS